MAYEEIIDNKNKFLKLTKFFIYIQEKQRGELFRLVRSIDKDLGGNYFKTFENNTTKSYIKFGNFMKIYGKNIKLPRVAKEMRKRKFTTQALDGVTDTIKNLFGSMFGNLNCTANIPTEISTTLHHIQNTTIKADTFFEKATEVQDSLLKAFSTLSEFFTGSDQNNTLLIWIFKLIAFLNLLRNEENRTATNIASLIVLIFPTGFGEQIIGKLSDLSLAIQGVIIRFVQKFTIQANDNHDCSIIVAFFKLIRDMFVNTTTGVDRQTFMDMKLNADRVTFITRNLREVKNIYEYFLKMVQYILEYFGYTLLANDTHDGEFTQEAFEKLLDDYYLFKEQREQTQAIMNKRVALYVKDMLDRTRSMICALVKLSSLEKGKDLVRIIPNLRVLERDLNEILNEVPEFLLTDEDSRRNKPYWCYIFGKPRIGKSAFFQYLLLNELVLRGKLIDEYQNLSAYTYFRRCGAEFWDGYTGQLVTWYNDIFQLNSTSAEVVKTVGELTDIVDDNPCLVNMAHVERKEKIFFKSKIVISNAQGDLPQQQFLANNCWSSGVHILQRRNCVVELILHARYTKNDGTIDHKTVQAAMNDPSIEKINCLGVDLVPSDMYVVKFRDPTSGNATRISPLSESVTIIVDDMIRYMNSQDEFKGRLFKFFENRFKIKDEKGNVPPLNNQCFDITDVKPTSSGQAYVTTITARLKPPDITSKLSNEVKQAIEEAQARSAIGKLPIKKSSSIGERLHALKRNGKTQMQDGNDDGDSDDLSGWTTPLTNGPKNCRCWFTIGSTVNRMYFQKLKVPQFLEDLQKSFETPHTCGEPDEIEMKVFEEFEKNNQVHIYNLLIPTAYSNRKPPRRPNQKSRWQLMKERMYKCCGHIYKSYFKYIKAGIHYVTIMVCMYAITFLIGFVATTAGLWVANKINGVIHGKKKQINYDRRTQTAEYQKHFKPVRIYRKYGKKGNLLRKTQGYDESNVAIENTIKNNFIRMTLVVHQGQRIICNPQIANAVAVFGSTFVTPKHYYCRYEQILHNLDYDDAYYTINLPNGTETKVNIDQVEWFLPRDVDAVYFCVKNMSAFKDISHFFVKDSDELNLTQCYLYGVRSSTINGADDLKPAIIPVTNTVMEDASYDSGTAINIVNGAILDNLEFDGIDHFIYNTNLTVQGDCGMLLIAANARTGARKIMGIHVAASAPTQEGISCPVFLEDLEEARTYFNKKGMQNIKVQSNDFINLHDTALGKIEYQIIKESKLCYEGKLKAFQFEGKNYQGYVPIVTKTNIQKSVSFDMMEKDFGNNITKPAQLTPFENEHGVRISPLIKALSKYQTKPRHIEEKYKQEIVDHIVDTFNESKNYPISNRRVWSDDEALNGFGCVKQIDIQTSAGYPYTLVSNDGKKFWLNIEQIEQEKRKLSMKNYVKQQVNERIELAKLGIIKSTIFCDTLKDETRPIEKVDAGKTRIFQIGPLDLTIVMRKYFGAFIDMVHSSFLKGEIAIGIDPNSVNWGLKYRRFLQLGRKGWAGDFGNYDASIWSQLAHWIASIINSWYDGTEEENFIRLVLLVTLFHSYHAILNFVFLLLNGNPSGNVLTTIINCLVFMIMIRLFYLKHVDSSLLKFKQLMQPWIFGDDNLVIFRYGMVFSMTLAQRFFAFYGMEYTDAMKTGVMDDCIDIDDMNFLKRKWTQVGEDIMAPMPLENIVEIPRWSESDPMNMDDQLARYNASLLEVSNHGNEIFQLVRKKYYKQLLQLNDKGFDIKVSRLFSFMRCYDIKRPSISKFTTEMNDLIKDVKPKNHKATQTDLHFGGHFTASPEDAFVDSETLKSLKFGEPVGHNSNNSYLYSFTRNVRKDENLELLKESIANHDLSRHGGTLCKSCFRYPCLDWCLKDTPRSPRTPMLRYGKPRTQSNETHGDTDAPVVVTTEKSTRFEDAPETTVNLRQQSRLPYLYPRSFQQNMSSIVGRPFQVGSFVWNANDTMGVKKFSAIFPAVLRNISEIKDACLYHAYMRPEITMLVKVNGTPMHYGKLMISMGYLDRYFENVDASWTIASMSNVDWVQISANSVRSAEVEVPWMSPYERYPTILLFSEEADDTPNFAQMDIRVSVPLLLNGNGTPSVSVSIYLVIKNAHFSGWNVPGLTEPKPPPEQPVMAEFKTQSLDAIIDPICEAVESAKQGVLLSTITSDIATWMSKFKAVPVIGTPVSIASSVAGSISKLIKSLGFSVPANVRITTPFFPRMQRLLQFEDVANSVPLAPVPNPYVVKDPSFVGMKWEDFKITEYLSHPSFYELTTIKGTDAPGTVLTVIPVSPDSYEYETDVANYVVQSRMAFLARLFYWWRGSIKFHFSFTASRFHSMRIRFTWYPFPPSQLGEGALPIATLTQNQLATLPSVIFDVNGDSDCSFTVPYLQTTEWQRLSDGFDAESLYKNHNNGFIYVTVVNSLVNSASESTTSGIFMQTFVSVGEDFQLAQPTLETIATNGLFAPQLIAPAAPPATPMERNFVTQMEESQNFSSNGLKKRKCACIGGLEPGEISENLHMSTNVISLKQLYNMGGMLSSKEIQPLENGSSTTYIGLGASMVPETNAEQNTIAQKNFLIQMAPAFGFYRGGLRVTIETINRVGTYFQPVVRVTYGFNTSFFNIVDFTTIFDGNVLYSSEGCHSYTRSQATSFTHDIPWYSPYRFWPNRYTDLPVEAPVLGISAGVNNTTVYNIYEFLSGGDDFMMFWDSPMPLMWKGGPVLPTVTP